MNTVLMNNTLRSDSVLIKIKRLSWRVCLLHQLSLIQQQWAFPAIFRRIANPLNFNAIQRAFIIIHKTRINPLFQYIFSFFLFKLEKYGNNISCQQQTYVIQLHIFKYI